MNLERAKQLEGQLHGQCLEGWTIESLINFGKSAAVFKAVSHSTHAAVKVFYAELIDRFGAEVQAERIEREKSLIDKVHPNLVKVYGGGFWKDLNVFYIIMEFLPWKNIAQVLKEIPVGSERRIISQIASAAHFLEGLGICHRDIKPENIAISNDFQNVKLLDLGVIKPQGTKPLTDGTGSKIFVGTLKYSPIEFLLREEKDTTEAWRAISFYQIGGVLHDLIMRRPLFADFDEPYARLVIAVKQETPRIESTSVSPSLVDLARFCLLKKAQTRLQLVDWNHFEEEPPSIDNVEAIKSQIIKRNQARQSEAVQTIAESGKKSLDKHLDSYSEDLQSTCRLVCIDDRSIFPPVEIRVLRKNRGIRHFFAQFEPSVDHSLPLFVRVEVCISWLDGDSEVCEVSTGFFFSKEMIDVKTSCVDCSKSIFKGIYAADTVRRAITEALYQAIYAAQTAEIDKTQSFQNQIIGTGQKGGENE